MNAKKTLTDLLKLVPATAQLRVTEQSIPVGRICAEAAEEIETLRKAKKAFAARMVELEKAVATEREACAALALAQKNNVNSYDRLVFNSACQDIFEAIRARGQE